MDDKTTTNDRGAGSDSPDTDKKAAPVSVPVTSTPEPEATILEETITRPAPAKPAPPPTPPAHLIVQAAEDRGVRVAPPPVSPPAQVEPTPAPTPTVTPPPIPVVRKIPLAVPPTAPVTPPPPATVVPPAPAGAKPEAGTIRGDIAQLLEGIKLPERRDSPNTESAGDTKPARTYDTSLGTVVSGEQQEEPKKDATPPVSAEQDSPPATVVGEAPTQTAPLHTLKSDLQEIVRVKKVSLVRAVALEQDKRRGSRNAEASMVPQRRGRLFGTLFAVVLLVGLGAAAIFGVYTVMQQRAGTTSAPTPDSPILFAETTVPLSLAGLSSLDLKRLLAQVRASGGATLGSITNIVPVVSVRNEDGTESLSAASLGEFLTALGSHVPPDLLRALEGGFFLGLHTVDENAPLVVIPVTSYERAFAGMLAWEGTINADLSPLFTLVPDQIAGPGGLPQKRQFEDLVMRNYDVRALKNDAGGIELYYSFPTQNILIIGESPYSFAEILSRLRAERKL